MPFLLGNDGRFEVIRPAPIPDPPTLHLVVRELFDISSAERASRLIRAQKWCAAALRELEARHLRTCDRAIAWHALLHQLEGIQIGLQLGPLAGEGP